MDAKRQKNETADLSKTEDEKLDEALDESFPASDPPSITDPTEHVGNKKPAKKNEIKPTT